jgi:hypothetical protein
MCTRRSLQKLYPRSERQSLSAHQAAKPLAQIRVLGKAELSARQAAKPRTGLVIWLSQQMSCNRSLITNTSMQKNAATNLASWLHLGNVAMFVASTAPTHSSVSLRRGSVASRRASRPCASPWRPRLFACQLRSLCRSRQL